MRVLMTTDTLGGVWTYAVQLAAALRPHGVQVVMATAGGPVSPAQRRQADALSNVTLVESEDKLEWMDEPWADVGRTGRWLLDLERQYAVDVVHLNGYAYGQQPFDAPVLVVAHSCCLSWWHAVKGEAASERWERYRAEVAAGIAGADLWVAPTHAMLGEIERLYAPRVPGRVIHNGRDGSAFTAGEKQDVVLSAGRLWDEAKNLAALRTVAGKVHWPIRVAGSRVHPDGGTADAAGLELLGVLDEAAMARHLSSAAVYALPARYEPFGLSVLEAALSGCCLVLGDIASLREIWGDAAIYVDPDRPAALGDAINGLIADPATRRTFAARSTRRAQKYSAAAMAERYSNAYREQIAARQLESA